MRIATLLFVFNLVAKLESNFTYVEALTSWILTAKDANGKLVGVFKV